MQRALPWDETEVGRVLYEVHTLHPFPLYSERCTRDTYTVDNITRVRVEEEGAVHREMGSSRPLHTQLDDALLSCRYATLYLCRFDSSSSIGLANFSAK